MGNLSKDHHFVQALQERRAIVHRRIIEIEALLQEVETLKEEEKGICHLLELHGMTGKLDVVLPVPCVPDEERHHASTNGVVYTAQGIPAQPQVAQRIKDIRAVLADVQTPMTLGEIYEVLRANGKTYSRTDVSNIVHGLRYQALFTITKKDGLYAFSVAE